MTSELVILYITIYIGDIVRMGFVYNSEELGNKMFLDLLTRIIPIAIVGFVSMFLLIKINAKKGFISQKDDILKKIFIVPAVVAIILLIFGIYSVNSNIKEFEEEYTKTIGVYKTWYSYLYSGDEYEGIFSSDEINNVINEARNSAILLWTISSVSYLVMAEAASFMMKNKLDGLLKEDENMNFENAEIIKNEENYNFENEKGEDIENNDSSESAVSSVKWDL